MAKASDTETWKETTIDSLFGYKILISNHGNVKRVYLNSGEEKPIRLKFDKTSNRLDLNKIYKDENGNKRKIGYKKTIHKLVAELFVANPDQLPEVIHIDRNIANNHSSNLAWVNKNEFRVHHSNYLSQYSTEKLQFFASEKFKDFHNDQVRKRKYAISNFGRVVIYTHKLEEGYFLKFNQKAKIRTPYLILKPQNETSERKAHYVHQLVATNFLPPRKEGEVCVIHLDHNHENNHYSNLKWTTKVEKYEHSKQSPRVRAVQGDLMQKGNKLSKTQVIHIKRLIAKGKTRNKIIAKQFGISEMSVYRIKRGEAWAHVKIENE